MTPYPTPVVTLLKFRFEKAPRRQIIVVVSKKVAPTASKRNLLKRRVRAIVRMWYDKVPQGRYFVYTYRGVTDSSYNQIKETLDHDLNNLSRLTI